MEKVRFVFHIADIHCRLFQRHREYREVFERLFDKIKEIGTKDSLIVIAGDIVHSKTEMSPELISLVSYFLKGCADLCPTIVIPGNHDFQVTNQNRLDALTPIVEALDHPQLLYWRESGIKQVGDIRFHHFSIMGDRSEWDSVAEGNLDMDTHVALYHGAVEGAETSTGFNEFSDAIPISVFKFMDIVMLGDIHKLQWLNAKRTIAYPGSLLQQDFGESVDGHGFLLWDIKTREAKHISIENNYAFVTIDPADGIPNTLPSQARVRIIHGGDRDDIKEFTDTLKSMFGIRELQIIGNNEKRKENLDVLIDESVREHIDVSDINFQKRLLKDFLPDVDNNIFDRIIQINNDLNSRLRTVDTPVRGIKWAPIRFTFSNMFSYGENNVIDFRNLRGIVGLFAPNAAGKSTFLDSIVYCIFDKCTRTNRAAMVMNNAADTFYCELEFMIGTERFMITRDAKRQSNGEIKVDVDFVKFEGDQKKILNGKRRDDTNKIIRDYIGSYDDFVLTTMSTQIDNRTFIDMTKKDRQELLYRFLNLYVFIDLYNLAKDDSKLLAGQVKQLESVNYSENIAKCRDELKEIAVEAANNVVEVETAKEKIRLLTAHIESMIGTKVPIDESLNIHQLNDSENKLIREKLLVEEEIKHYHIERNQSISFYEINKKQRDQFEFDMDTLRSSITDLQKTKHRVALLEQERKHLQGKVSALETHQYDPNCQFCTQNQFVVDAKRAEVRLKDVGSELEGLYSQETIQLQIDGFASQLEKLEILIKHEQKLRSKILQCEGMILENTNKISRLDGDLSNILEKKERYNQQIENIRKNELIESGVLELKNSRASLQMTLDELITTEKNINGRFLVLDSTIQTNKDMETQYHEKVLEFKAYDHYMQAVNRDGIPYTMLSKLLPHVENQVNEILSGIVDFTFKLYIGDSDSIDGKIVYGDREWAIELVSGMERFILSLAIRSSLIQLSGLSQPNFLAIDEGFGVLDGDNLNSIHLLFDHFKKNFDFILCISHISGLKDYVDSVMSIEKQVGFSMIRAA